MAEQRTRSQSGGSLKVTTIGKSAKSAVPAVLFGEPFNESLVHEAARADLNARRQGTHSSLTRGEVAMTGAKAWRQKGTGRARVGALSVPHRRGGGNAFATKPRNYTFKVNRKARRKALRSALSVHAARDSLAVLPAGAFSEPATKQAAEGIAKWAPTYPVLVLLSGEEAEAGKSFRNLPKVTVLGADDVGVAEIIGHRSMIASEDAIEILAGRVGDVSRGNGEPIDTPADGQEPEAAEDAAEPEAPAEEVSVEEEKAATGEDAPEASVEEPAEKDEAGADGAGEPAAEEGSDGEADGDDAADDGEETS